MFGKLKTAEGVLNLIRQLPEEEQEKLYHAIVDEEDEETPEKSAEEPEEGKDEEADGEQAETGESDLASGETEGEPETPEEGETEEAPEGEPETTPETPSEEAEPVAAEAGDSPADTEAKDAKDTFEALAARLNSVEERLAKMEQDLVGEEDFGLSQNSAPKGTEETSRYDAVMNGYAGGDAKKYK